MPITDLHVFMTGAHKLVSAKVWFGLSLKCRARLCVRIDALIHASCTHVNKRSKPTRWLHDHNCWENLSFPALLYGQLRHPKMTSQVSFGEGVFIRAVQIGITNAPDAVAATSPALASRWEDEVSRHRSVESALLARSCASFPCRFSRPKRSTQNWLSVILRFGASCLCIAIQPSMIFRPRLICDSIG